MEMNTNKDDTYKYMHIYVVFSMLLCTMLLIRCCTLCLYGSIQAEVLFGWKHDTAPKPCC